MSDSIKFIEQMEARNKYLGNIGNIHSGLFDGPKQYLNAKNLYFLIHNSIPNRITMHHTKVNKIISKIEKEFSDRIIEKHYMRYSFREFAQHKYSHVVYVMENRFDNLNFSRNTIGFSK